MDIEKYMHELLAGRIISFKKSDDLGDLIKRKFRKSIGLPCGQIADYRGSINGFSIHIKEYYDKYEVHLDKYDPRYNPFMHLIKDVPKPFIISVAAMMDASFSVILSAFMILSGY
ncbi:hypothetical protein [Picrophilus oshimae]|nr:hypothetical protein [Picrophilus oshimae]